jgi:hypothetical protein
MKRKEIIQLGVALVIFVIAAYLIYIQVAPKKAPGKGGKGVTVEVVTPIPAGYSQDELDSLQDQSKNRDFYTKPDLQQGIGNSQPFASLH